ncbi:glycosyltransferase [Thermocrinis minervae]|uniref:Glycosyltransferase involved in cell wall bisynthesis n=1 Tax=Thermocrinis minervae TaxID=381751 RepID=A0A1M6SSB4_9AQUI|nr:glycosyltransferase [Thermocrinis minervae]SHK47530.1 Glycosyltransferase involved in cell wall bisynthesis [Thermocrinis minervae]
MRVLSVVDGYGWGGTKQQVFLLARELSKSGIKVDLALAFENLEMVQKLRPYSVGFRFFERRKGAYRLNPLNYYRLWKIIQEGSYDFVIANSPHALDYVSLVYRFLKERPKLIVVKRSSRKPNPFSIRFKYMLASRVVCVSREVAKVMEEAGIPPERIRVINSAIDLEIFKPMEGLREIKRKELGLGMDRKVFINVANWNPPVKAQDMLIKVFSRLECKDCVLLLVGYDTDVHAKKIAKEYGVEDRVVGLGFRQDVNELLNASDFFLLSSYFEGFPNALLQAMAVGLVCISTAVSGAVEIIEDGHNGFLVPVGDWETYLQKMKLVLELKREEREDIGFRAMQSVQLYSPSNMARKYMELFEELC